MNKKNNKKRKLNRRQKRKLNDKLTKEKNKEISELNRLIMENVPKSTAFKKIQMILSHQLLLLMKII